MDFPILLMELAFCFFSYSRQLAMALDYCHANGVLHLDVKPANVMVNGEKWIKLGDFGNSASVQHLEYFQVSIVISCFQYLWTL